MPVVAVAGGTGQLGRTIVDALLADGSYDVIILVRRANPTAQKEIGVPLISVNYANVDDLVSTLESHNVNTVISTITTLGDNEPELNLIKAAEKSQITKRFVPSYWATDYPDDQTHVAYPVSRFKLEVLSALDSTSLEYTAFVIGIFTDYYVAPHVKTNFGPQAIYVDAAHGKAAIPGSGKVPNQFVYSLDVAKFVVASLALPKWDKRSYIIGDRVTWNDFVAILEAAKGVKFDVTHDSVSSLAAGEITELPGHEELYKVVPKEQVRALLGLQGIIYEQGGFDYNPEHSINDLFPSITPKSVRELAEGAWGGNGQ